MEQLIKELQIETDKLDGKFNLSPSSPGSLHPVYPFNRFEYLISHLIACQAVSLERYLKIRSSYLERNKYLYLFEMSPRTFGETWGQRHLNEMVPELQPPAKSLDPEYSGQYDFWYDGIRIEVKASRAVKRKSGETLLIKALSKNSKSGFDMNFQQIKPACCDVFVWIGVWRDAIRYWVLSSREVETCRYYSVGQHRGNAGEGQLWIKETNINDFDCYEVSVSELLDMIIKKGKHQ